MMMLGTYYHSRFFNHFFRKSIKGKLLDVGGRDGFLLSLVPGKEKHVVDLRPITRFTGIEYHQIDAIKMPFKKNSFQTVFSFNAIEHVERPFEFIQALLNATCRGGRIYILTAHPKIKIWPPFLTGWAEVNLWHHASELKLSEKKFQELLMPYKQKISWRYIYFKNFFYRFFYLFLWLVWHRSERIGRLLVDPIIRLDRRFPYGENGMIMVIIDKK